MKKLASLVLALTVAFSCVGCWGNKKPSAKTRSMPTIPEASSMMPFNENGAESTHPSDAYFNPNSEEAASQDTLTGN